MNLMSRDKGMCKGKTQGQTRTIASGQHSSPIATPIPARLQGLPALVDARTRVLVLGSFPGAASLAQQQYYAHPRNQFWPLLAAIWPHAPQPSDYAQRCQWLLARGVGLWDVYASCERQGSLDSAIRYARLNPLHTLKDQCPQLQLIAHNGAESYRHAAHSLPLAASVIRLPSTSPANATWSFARKLNAWKEAMAQAGLLAPKP